MTESTFIGNFPPGQDRVPALHMLCGNDHLGDLMFIGMADDVVHSFNFFDFRRIDLGITSGDDNTCIGIVANGLPDGLPRLHGCFLSDRTGVDDTQVGVFFTK